MKSCEGSDTMRDHGSTFGRMKHTRGVDHNHVRAVAILHTDVNLAGVKASRGVTFKTLVF
jgi:hypothetical protein